jgi:predicted NUDIX family NTP pyrophosphohydrolase
MGVRSAGLLLYRFSPEGVVEVLIAHPGGPFWARKDDAAWSIPKGEYLPEEDALVAAYREFEEEVGLRVPAGAAVFLGERRQPGGKRVRVWGLEGELDVTRASSNTFELEWPRGSGTLREFPEVDRVEWVPVDQARRKLLKGQVPFLDALLAAVAPEGTGGTKGLPGRLGTEPPDVPG